MIRDDILKRKMLAGRPEPTPEYLNNIHSTLTKLPAGKATLFKALPVSAVVFVAVAVLCVVAVNNKTVAGLLAGGSQPAGQQLAAGDVPSPSQTPSAMPETPEPTPTPAETPEPTPSFTTYETPTSTHSINSAEPSENEFVTKFLNGEIDLRDMKETKQASSGAMAYGNKAYVTSIFSNSDAVIYECIADDNKAGDLQRYLEGHSGKEGNPLYKALIKPKQDTGILVFTICKGLVDKDYVLKTLTTDDLNLPINSERDYPGRMYDQGIYAVMEHCETGKFCIYVINVNPDYRPVSGCTIFSRYYSDTEEGESKLEGTYALPIYD